MHFESLHGDPALGHAIVVVNLAARDETSGPIDGDAVVFRLPYALKLRGADLDSPLAARASWSGRDLTGPRGGSPGYTPRTQRPVTRLRKHSTIPSSPSGRLFIVEIGNGHEQCPSAAS